MADEKIIDVQFNESDNWYGNMQADVILEDGFYEMAFSYFRDEISFSREELIGLTLEEARDLFDRKIKKAKPHLWS